MNASKTALRGLDGLLARAAAQSSSAGISIANRHGATELRSYPELLTSVKRRAGQFAAHGVRPGEVVLIALETSFDWIDCWFGALHAGALPLAIAPNGPLGSGRAHLDKLDKLIRRLEIRALIAGDGLSRDAQAFGLDHLLALHVTPQALAQRTPEAYRNSRNAPDDIAFLQLTSGSTGSPRAVAVRHDAVLHQVDAIAGCTGLAERGAVPTRGVSWLPLHHDMGMVGSLLVSIAHGWSLDLLPPRLFIARPESWLSTIARHRRVISPAPNFAYQACLERNTAGRLDGLDLSGWTVGLTGAEMVRPDTVEEFARVHAPLGFDRRAIRPCYGLAEATLSVTFDARGLGLRTASVPGDPSGKRVACVGAPIQDTLVRVTDAHGNDLPERTVGSVRVNGPGVFAGYYRDAIATNQALVGGELLTGDLGFLQDGELYITGRSKDLLIIRGSNVMPHELEWCAEAAVGGGGLLRAGAFSVDGGRDGELAVIVVETVETDPAAKEQVEREVRLCIGRELGLSLHDVVLVRRGRLPKTTSGKIQRAELRRRYLDNELER